MASSVALADAKRRSLVDQSLDTARKGLELAKDFPDTLKLMPKARGVLIVPELVQGGFIIGAAGGCAASRYVTATGASNWSYPAFYGMGSGSVGFQVGGKVSEIIFVILTEKGLHAIIDHKFQSGAEAGVTVLVAVGAGIEGASTSALGTDIVAFANSNGLFAGASLEGSYIDADNDWNSPLLRPGRDRIGDRGRPPLQQPRRRYARRARQSASISGARSKDGPTNGSCASSARSISYVNERRDVALRSHHLVVTDDDVSGTFAFPRTLADYGFPAQLTSRQIGNGWLNYIVEDRSILWWGGIGNSTEHTAYLRLKSGVEAPHSGSIALNGKTVAEQIGAQIFIDGWAMVSPGNPDQAAYLAEQAGRVSHDGEAVHAARLLAAVKHAVETDVQRLFGYRPRLRPGRIAGPARVVNDVRDWHAGDNSNDWERTRALIAERYGYDKFKGNCHVIPNHALIILATLYGGQLLQALAMHRQHRGLGYRLQRG